MSVNSIAREKSTAFSKRIIRMYQFLCSERNEYVLSKQLLRSGTSIGANISEAIFACSRKDFAAKMKIAQKEASETLYWLELLHSGDYISDKLFHSFSADCKEILAIVSATIKTIQNG